MMSQTYAYYSVHLLPYTTPIQKLMAARHQSMGRCLSNEWVGGQLKLKQ